MFRIPLVSDDTCLVLVPRAEGLGPAGQVMLLSFLLVVPIALVAWLYRAELRSARPWAARGLLMLRLLFLTLLWCLVALQPTLSHVSAEKVPSRIAVAVDVSASMDTVDVQRSDAENAELARVLGATGAEAARWSRRDIARRLLTSAGADLCGRLARQHQVELAAFHETRWTIAPDLADALFAPETVPRATDLRQALTVSGSSAAAPLNGVIVLTDGRHTRGPSPVDTARQLGVPVYPILVAAERPPADLCVAEVRAPDRVFKGATLPVAVRIRVTQLPAQELTVELAVQGKAIRPEDRRRLNHPGGDAVHELTFELPLPDAGTHVLEVRATAAKGGEVTQANNVRRRIVRVAEAKARVLLVEAEARWEYHYLATALERDPTVRLDRVLFAPPRLGLLKSEEERGNLPRLQLPAMTGKTDPLLDYDCIIVGDVEPEQLPLAARRRLERFVAERGGTLVLVAGKRAMPLAYTKKPAADEPLVKLLPVREPRVFKPKDGFALELTEAGKQAPFLRLDAEGGWPELPKHYWAVVGKRQPGATALLMPQGEQTGLLVQQPYGLGRVVFAGLDSTWRWRYRTGDTYHHRFWGQLVRWAAADRLLPAGNAYARFGTREPVYRPGEPIPVMVRLHEAGAAIITAHEQAVVQRVTADGTSNGQAAVVPLREKPGQPRLLEGQLRDLPPGTYAVDFRPASAPGQPAASAPPGATFTVLPEENDELLNLAPDRDLLQALADVSQGRLFTVAEADQLVELLARKVQPREIRQNSRFWQDAPLVWWTLGMLLGLVTLEWAWRKRLGLP